MQSLTRIRAIFTVAIKRLMAQRGLALATLAGLVTVIALTMSIPMYADAIYNRVLMEQVSTQGNANPRPPFAFMFNYIGSLTESAPWDKVKPLDQFMSTEAAPAIGLPVKIATKHFETDKFGLYPPSTQDYSRSEAALEWVSFCFSQDIEKHITLVEGHWPAAAETAPGSLVEVLMHETLATKIGAQAGEAYYAYASIRTKTRGQQVYQIPVRIAGIWKPNDLDDEFWFYRPTNMETMLHVPETTFTGRLNSQIDEVVYVALWYWVMDGTRVRSNDAVPLLGRISGVSQRVEVLLSSTRLWVSPVEGLQRYQQITEFLTLFLYILSIPIVGLFLAFISLVIELSVERQRNEIAMLRSRGATVLQVAGIAVLEALLLGLVALALSVPTSSLVATLIGRTRSFMNFSAPGGAQGLLTRAALQFGVFAIGLTVAIQMLPTLGAAQHTIVTYKQERARTLRPPWWQRAWLDVILLIPAGYGAYLLRRQGSIVIPIVGQSISHDPFQNPLLFLVPALGILALTLMVVRGLPFVMRFLAWLAARTPSVGFLMAVRHLARTPGLYTAPMMLLVLTLSLSTFTASLARTLDRHLYDQTRYQFGADMSLRDMGETIELGNFSFSPASGGSQPTQQKQEEQIIQTTFRPVTDYLAIPGAQDATRVGRYNAEHEGTRKAVLIGVDRVDFARIATWRRDFASASLGALMNNLAVVPDGVIVSNAYLRQQGLSVGDQIPITVQTRQQTAKLLFQIVGGVDLFPTWYPQDGPVFVANLDYVLDQMAVSLPYDVWIKLAANADAKQIEKEISQFGPGIVSLNISPKKILAEQSRPERQGMFGVLSVGFVAAALLTVLGFMLYALFSFRSRFIELGVLRAIGLSVEQMASFLAWELAFLLLVGLVVGTGVGIWTSQFYIPYLQIGETATAYVPPYIIEIAWPDIVRIYILFGLLFVAALGGLGALLMRIKIFQAVKLGETT
jgi:putative ABC transport system permease protein